jgi:hypothetical protein
MFPPDDGIINLVINLVNEGRQKASMTRTMLLRALWIWAAIGVAIFVL